MYLQNFACLVQLLLPDVAVVAVVAAGHAQQEEGGGQILLTPTGQVQNGRPEKHCLVIRM